MRGFILITMVCFLFYLLLSVGSGELLLWSAPELVIGLVFSLVVAFISKNLVSWDFSNKVFNPKRWFLFAVYLIGPFLYNVAHANLDVAYRVITRKINPGIVRVKTELKTDLATMLLANSITLTPGTLSVDVAKNNDLFVHWINVEHEKPEGEEVYGMMGKFVKKVME